MFGLGKMWIYGLAALALVAAVAFGIKHIYDTGYDARDNLAKADAAEAQRLATKTTSELKEELADVRSTNDKVRHDAKVEIDSLRARVHDGSLRLRVTGSPAACVCGGTPVARAEAGAQPDQASRASAVPGGQLPAVTLELDPALALELISITDDGDQAIRDLNECVDEHETLRKKLNGLQKRTD